MDTAKIAGLANFPHSGAANSGVEGGGGPLRAVAVVDEDFMGRDRCAGDDGVPLSSPASSSSNDGEEGSGSGGAVVPLRMLSETPSTARLLAKLPPAVQRAIARQNRYYYYLRDEVFELNTRTGAWRIKQKKKVGNAAIENGGAPVSNSKGGSSIEVDVSERGILRGNWASFVVPDDPSAIQSSGNGGGNAAASEGLPLVAPIIVNAEAPEAGMDPSTGAVRHWDDTAALETRWYASMPKALASADAATPAEGGTAKVGGSSDTSGAYATPLSDGLCPLSRSVPLPVTTPLLAERFANKRLLFLGDSMIRNTFVMTIARLCNYANGAQCMARMPTYEFDIFKKEPWEKGPIGCRPREGVRYANATTNSNGDKNPSPDGEEATLSIGRRIEEAISSALKELQGTDAETVAARKQAALGRDSAPPPPTAPLGGDGGSANNAEEEKRLAAAEKRLQEVLSLSPCYRHAQMFDLKIKKLTVGQSRRPGMDRMLSKGDLIPPTINAFFPSLNLTLIYLSVVKPKMIWTVAHHIGWLNGFSSHDAAGTVSKAAVSNGRTVTTHIPLRYFGVPPPPKSESAAVAPAASMHSRRGFDVPTTGPRYGFLAFLDGIFVSIGPHLKYHDLLHTPYSYADSLAFLKSRTNNAPMVVAEFTHVLRAGAPFARLIDRVSEAIRARLAVMAPDPPLFVPQRFVTQFMFHLRDARNATHEDSSRPMNSVDVRNTVFSPADGRPLFGPRLRSPQGGDSASSGSADDMAKSPTDLLNSFELIRNSGGHDTTNGNDAARFKRFFSPEVANEGGGTLTGIAGCGYYDNQHPALRCHAVLSELLLAGMLAKLAGREAALEEVVEAMQSRRA